jgi:phosphohistidine phosphatase
MRVYLVRHGEALPKEVDPERGLSDEGKAGAGKVASFLKGLAIEVEAVWESGKKRATETAEIMASAVSAKGGIVCQAGMAPMDPVAPIAEMISSLEGDYMLVGHLPFLSILASRLILGREEPDVVGFPAAAVVCLARGASGQWTVSWMVTPDLL